MPFADHLRRVAGGRQDLGQDDLLGWESPIAGTNSEQDVLPGPGRLQDMIEAHAYGVAPGEESGAGGRADGLGDVGVLEDETFAGEFVEIGGMNGAIAIGGHCVGPLLVGPDEEEVGFSLAS